MSDKTDVHGLRTKTDEELCEWIAEWNDQRGVGYRILGQHELQRRLKQPEAIRSWLAISIWRIQARSARNID